MQAVTSSFDYKLSHNGNTLVIVQCTLCCQSYSSSNPFTAVSVLIVFLRPSVRKGTVSLGMVPTIWWVEVLRMLSPPAQEDVAAAGEDGGELKVKPVPLLLIPTPLLDYEEEAATGGLLTS